MLERCVPCHSEHVLDLGVQRTRTEGSSSEGVGGRKGGGEEGREEGPDVQRGDVGCDT